MLLLETLFIALFLVATASGNLYWFYIWVVNVVRTILARFHR